MKKTSIIILSVSAVLTILLLVIWFVGLIAGQTFGGLIHLLFVLSFVTGFGCIVGLILLIVSFVRQK